jgi:hypothetical protein
LSADVSPVTILLYKGAIHWLRFRAAANQVAPADGFRFRAGVPDQRNRLKEIDEEKLRCELLY